MDQRPGLPEKMRDEHSGNQGESTIMKRKEMLSRKQEMLRESIRELENSIDYIDWKQNFYDEVLSGKRPYVSNLICLKEETD